jgi:hypothetical protein
VAKVQDRCFVWDCLSQEINPEEFLKGVPIIDGFFDSRIAQGIPLLEEVYLEQEEEICSFSPCGFFFNELHHDIQKHLPWNDAIHLIEKPLTTELFCMRERKETGLIHALILSKGAIEKHLLWGVFFRGSLEEKVRLEIAIRNLEDRGDDDVVIPRLTPFNMEGQKTKKELVVEYQERIEKVEHAILTTEKLIEEEHDQTRQPKKEPAGTKKE